MKMRTYIISTLVLLVLAGGVFYYFISKEVEPLPEPTEVVEPEPQEEALLREERVIGRSVEGRDIEAVTFGDGEQHLLFVGGVHGGYEWNSVLLAYEFIDYIDEHPDFVPEDVTISVIPSANPDGIYDVVGTEGRFALADVPNPDTRVAEARFNANDVDLNRNFDCKWEPESTWRGNTVSAGSAPFSEPEARAIRDFVLATDPEAVVFWHSQANNVYASECEEGVLPKTLTLMNTYANAAGYGAVPSFDAYPITGDAEGWLASVGIPAVTVELASYRSPEWDRNLAGTTAVIEHYSTAK